MKQLLFAPLFLAAALHSQAQQPNALRTPEASALATNTADPSFSLAKEYFQKGQYNLAWPLLRDLRRSIRETDRINRALDVQDVEYYTIASMLMLGEPRAAVEAQQYINVTRNNARVQQMNFQLAEYEFRQGQYAEALAHYEAAGTANISDAELGAAKFHQGYAYFTQKQFAAARPLFAEVRARKDDPNRLDAAYYYGFISFADRNYSEALNAFREVEDHPVYQRVVPYYVAQIYYVQGRKEEAIRYAEEKIRQGKAQQYDLELKQLLGHAYFEKGQFAAALPYLEEYVRRSQKVRREDLYELSYSYYQQPDYNKAIEGFRQLSGKEDSLSQHAMYLLGDAYLKTNQKSNARNAFLFSASNSSNASQREIARFQYAKLSYELGYQDEALRSLRSFVNDYPASPYNAEATELLVAALANTNNYRDALTLLEGLKNPSPGARRLLPRILYGRATELINDGLLGEADALLDRALRAPDNAPVLPFVNFWKGEIAYRGNRIDDAIRYYTAYLNAGAPAGGDANERNVKYNLGYSYLRKENYKVAQSFFEPLARNVSLGSDALTQDAYLRAADTYFMQKLFAQARTMYDNVIRFSWPAEDYATYQKALITGITNSNEKISLLNNLIRKFPSSSLVDDANMEIANTYLADERYREAVPYLVTLTKASGNATSKPQVYLKLGIAYFNQKQYNEAIAQFNTIITQYKASEEADDALENLRTIYVEQGQPNAYVDAARRAGKPLSVNAEDSLTYSAAQLQLENGNTAAAQTQLEGYLQRFGTGAYSLDAHHNLAGIYINKRDSAAALPHYEVVAERAPNRFAEGAVLQAARIYFFSRKDYAQAEKYYQQLKGLTGSQETRLEAMRGLLRSQYLQQKWADATANARDLVALKGSSTDDKALANMVLGRSGQLAGQWDAAITAFRNVIAVNKAALAAEARYEIAASYLALNRDKDAEKAAFEVINKSGSYELWVTKSYLLLGDLYFRQKDYFNAKATFQSVADNSTNPELKAEATRKLQQVTEVEAANSKIGGQ
ncbi:tetratricopeptide repeat protein [Flaviaesturariibacter flavus]|uniref:Tetratricopeptide repeat protein n=1 Tax=Flaviaesturariibacter flavus TaxID=2502780 RepID=A0A4R1BR39_9BACT|nr:tetratricopeptide repeat protein [Flaviaesturariibacter flavus]TCJ19645.1 tetratricopeptide repeat protein [Flaviaesturariibacter flavus]